MGLGLVALGVGCLEFTLDKGQEKDWFGDPMIRTFAILAACRAHLLRLVGVEPPRPHRRPQAPQEPQLRHRRLPAAHPRHGALRLDRAHPAISADSARLHRRARRHGPLPRGLRPDGHDARRWPHSSARCDPRLMVAFGYIVTAARHLQPHPPRPQHRLRHHRRCGACSR